MRDVVYGEAKIEAFTHAMRQDERVLIIGGYAFNFAGLGFMHLAEPMLREFSDRVLTTPISEAAFTGAGVGAALAGARPIVTYGAASFCFAAWMQLVGEAANVYYMSGGQAKAPVVFHMLVGLRGGGAAQHSGRPQAQFMQVPGLQVVAPATSADFLALLPAVLASERTTVWIDHAHLAPLTWSVPAAPAAAVLGKADIKRTGKDVTLVAYSITLPRALNVANGLAAKGIDVEVVDLLTLAPLDRATVVRSVAKTGRLVVADEAHLSCGVAAEVVASVAEEGLASVKRVKRVTVPDVPIPMSPPLEKFITPTEERIQAAVEAVLN
jgi:acetoin:2,6-dichlorophenolindophenol oxidoreductase subunit beta